MLIDLLHAYQLILFINTLTCSRRKVKFTSLTLNQFMLN